MQSSQLVVSPIFSIPIGKTFLPNSVRLNERLKELFLLKESEGRTHQNPYPTQKQEHVFESEFELFSWKDDCVQELKEFVWNSVGRVIAQVNGFTTKQLAQLQIFSHTWFHITRSGGYFSAHNHPMASWSAVYCVSEGQSSPSHEESGVLRFLDARGCSNMFLDAANMNLAPPYSWGNVNFKLQAGQLVIFPSYLIHEVKPFFGTGERITVATNMWFKVRD